MFGAAYYDGTHFIVGNGTRILIYNGFPKSPGQKPDVVLGEPDLDTTLNATTASLFGNATSEGIWSDGERLAAIVGQRVLIWNEIPTYDLAPADIVLGQTDFTTNGPNSGGVSATSFYWPQAIASDGTRLAIADSYNQRVLVWSTFPVASQTPADIVIGQPDFTSSAADAGALPMQQPQGVDVTPAGVWVSGAAQPGLAFVATPSNPNPPATMGVFGWKWGNEAGALLGRPSGIVHLPDGSMGVRDYWLNNVAFTRGAPTGPANVAFALGQPDATRTVTPQWVDDYGSNPARVTASSLVGYWGASVHDGVVMLADEHRTLVYTSPPSFNGEPAEMVVGQAGFSCNEPSDYRGVSLATMASPADVAINGPTLAVADKNNNRVLLFHSGDVANADAAAFAAVGQPDGGSYFANADLSSPSATSLSGPEGVVLDGTHLVVADTENHRVLIWNTVPTTSDAPADVVLGQADFKGTRPNRARKDVSPLDGFSDVDADGFFYPTGVASDGTHLFVADRFNHRVLAWDSFPTQNGKPADRVLGQPTMTTVGANRGNGAFATAPDGFNLPTGLALIGTTLWVADTENNRVVRWDNATSTNTIPTAWIGQPNGSSVTNPNYDTTPGAFLGAPISTLTASSNSVVRPRAVAMSASLLFISETDSNRVHAFDSTALTPLFVLGQTADTEGAPNTNGTSGSSLAEPSGMATSGTSLFVADARNHRLLGFALAGIAGGAEAATVLGQHSMLSNGFNQSSVAAEGATSSPRGLALDGSTVFIADTGNNRI